jgi:hypothetical protein
MIRKLNKLFLIFSLSLMSLSSYAEITFQEILENPTDLKLNLNYAKQQEAKGQYKSTIASLERLNLLYPESDEIKLYLLTILSKMDSVSRLQLLLQQIENDINASTTAKDFASKFSKQLNEQLIASEKKKYGWYASMDIGFLNQDNSNITGVTKSKTFDVQNAPQPFVDALEYDKSYSASTYVTLGKKISDTESVNVNLGLNMTDQDKGTTLVNDTKSVSASYSKLMGKFYLTPYVSYIKYDYETEAVFQSKGVGASITYLVDNTKYLNFSSSLTNTEYNKDIAHTSIDLQNNDGYAASLAYNHGLTAKDVIAAKVFYNDTQVKADHFSNETTGINASFTHSFPFGTLRLDKTLSTSRYDEPDIFYNTTIAKINDKSSSNISLAGQVVQALPFLKFLDKNGTVYYSLSHTRINTRSTLINDDTIKEYTSFGFTKRFNWNE